MTFNGLAVGGLVFAAHVWLSRLPNRAARPDAAVAVRFDPVAIDGEVVAPLRLAGAWALRSADPRLGGLSALAVDISGLNALSDSGTVIRLPRPAPGRRVAFFHDLADGPGDARFKSHRDSEALARTGRGDWLVAFENDDQIWRYDPAFRRGRRVVDLRAEHWPRNRGVEAMALTADRRLVLIPEGRGTLIAIDGAASQRALDSGGWTVSDAARLPDGRLFVLLRRITAVGFRNALGELIERRGGWRIAVVARLPLGPLDNAEGLAAEPLPGGGTRLWAVTDNDHAVYRRTLLLALDLSAQRPAR